MVSSDLTADVMCRIEIIDDMVQRLNAEGELFNYNFQSGDVANHTIDKQALHDNQAVFRKLFVFSQLSSRRSFSKTALKSMTGGLASASRAAAKTRAYGSQVFG